MMMNQANPPSPKAIELASRDYTIVVERDEFTDGTPGFYATVSELPGCSSQGRTEAEAYANAKLAIADYIDFSLRKGWEIPAPQPRPKTTGHILIVHMQPIAIYWRADMAKPIGPKSVFQFA